MINGQNREYEMNYYTIMVIGINIVCLLSIYDIVLNISLSMD